MTTFLYAVPAESDRFDSGPVFTGWPSPGIDDGFVVEWQVVDVDRPEPQSWPPTS